MFPTKSLPAPLHTLLAYDLLPTQVDPLQLQRTDSSVPQLSVSKPSSLSQGEVFINKGLRSRFLIIEQVHNLPVSISFIIFSPDDILLVEDLRDGLLLHHPVEPGLVLGWECLIYWVP